MMGPSVTVVRRPGESDDDFMDRVDAVAAAGPPGHGIALVILPLPTDRFPDDQVIRAQCECGWFARFTNPITLERVNDVCKLPHGLKPVSD